MSKAYDLIVSLGANCSAAANMRRRGLRRCSLPFDWLYVVDDRPLLWLADHLQDGLCGFCLKENLVRITPEHPEWSANDVRKFKYIGTESGYRFIHLFLRPIETSDEYEFSVTNFEWSFPDDVKLTGRVIGPGMRERLFDPTRRAVRFLRHIRNARVS